MQNYCLKHGKHDGWTCPYCDIDSTVQRESEKSRKDAAKSTQALIEAQERATEEQARTYREAAEQAEEAAEEAAERTEEAIREGIEEQERIARDSWKMEADSKIDKAISLMKSGLYDEAISLGKSALSKDPSNIYGYLVIGVSRWQKNEREEAIRAYSKAIQLLTMDQWNKAGVFSSVLDSLPADVDPEIIDGYRRAVKKIDLEDVEKLSAFLTRLAARNHHPEIENIISRLSPEKMRVLFENRELVNVLYQSESKKTVGTMTETVASTISPKDVEMCLSVLSWSAIIDRECGTKHFATITTTEKLSHETGWKLLQCFAKERGNLKNPEDLERVTVAVSKTYSRMRDLIHQDIRKNAERTPYEEMKFSKAYLYGGLAIGLLYLIGSLIGNPQWSTLAHLFNGFGGGLVLGWFPAIFIRLVANSIRRDNARVTFLRKQFDEEATLIKECGLSPQEIIVPPPITFGNILKRGWGSSIFFLCHLWLS